MQKTNTMKRRKKLLVLVVITVAVVGALGAAYLYKKSTTEPPAQPTSPINYGPPTAEEEAESQARKDELRQQQGAAQDSGNQKQVTPVIINAYQDQQTVFLSAYVPGIAENGGSCTYAIVKGSQTVTKVTDGFANVSNTNCTPANINRSEFNQSGDWQVTVSYKSSSASGTSQSKILTVK